MVLDKKKKVILISVGVIFLGLVYVNKWLKKMPTKLNADEYSGLDKSLILKKGSKGDEVFVLQKILVNNFGADLGYSGAEKNGVDGEFGTMTENALMEAKGVNKIALKEIITGK